MKISQFEMLCQSQIKEINKQGYKIINGVLYYHNDKLGCFTLYHKSLPTIIEHSREEKLKQLGL